MVANIPQVIEACASSLAIVIRWDENAVRSHIIENERLQAVQALFIVPCSVPEQPRSLIVAIGRYHNFALSLFTVSVMWRCYANERSAQNTEYNSPPWPLWIK